MKSFVIAICVLIFIIIYISVTSIYFLRTEAHLVSALGAIDTSDVPVSSELLEQLCKYIEKRNKILSLYIHRSKCTELEFLLKEMNVHLTSGSITMLRLTETKLREALRDIRENDAFPTISGIT